MRILIADQDRDQREILRRICFGHRILEAKHSTEAIRLSKQVDLILTEIRFPGLAGKEYLEALKKRTDAKIVIVTAYYENPGMDHIIYKPFYKSQIIEAIGKYG